MCSFKIAMLFSKLEISSMGTLRKILQAAMIREAQDASYRSKAELLWKLSTVRLFQSVKICLYFCLIFFFFNREIFAISIEVGEKKLNKR